MSTELTTCPLLNLDWILRLPSCNHCSIWTQLFSFEWYTILASTDIALLVYYLRHCDFCSCWSGKINSLVWFGFKSIVYRLIKWIKLACVLITACIICMMRAISCWIVHFVPCFIQLNYKLLLTSIFRCSHITFNRILLNELSSIK